MNPVRTVTILSFPLCPDNNQNIERYEEYSTTVSDGNSECTDSFQLVVITETTDF